MATLDKRRGTRRVGLMSLFLLFCVGAATSRRATASNSMSPNDDASDDVLRVHADELIAKMTPEQKAGQLTQYFYIPMLQSPEAMTAAIASGEVGSLLMVSDPREVNRLQTISMEKSPLKIPLLFGFDVIHGLHTIYPVPLALAASWDPSLAEQVQSAAASEARAVGIDWTFAPMVDIARDLRWGRVVEGAGEDPYLGSAMAAAQVRGFQGHFIGSPGHIIAGPKHFVGYGAALGGRDYDEVDLSENQLWNVYLPPFKAAVDAGAGNIMTAYMALNGVPATANRWLLTTILRDTWGFKGFISSDSSAVEGLVSHGLSVDFKDASGRAMSAGLEMSMALKVGTGAFRALPDSMREGTVKQSDVDHALRDVLIAKERMGLFEHPYVSEAKAEQVLNDPAHLKLARAAAARSTVLLRNQHELLPLDRHRVKSIALIGPFGDSGRELLGPWVFPMTHPRSTSILEALRAKLGKNARVDYSEGVRIPPRVYPSPFSMMEKPPQRPPLDDATGIENAVALARNADVTVLVLGETWDRCGEAASTSSFDLPGRQQDLLTATVAVGKPIVLLQIGCRPIDLKDVLPDAILQIWYPGSAGADAVCDLLFGDETPSGKLPFTWVRQAAQSPGFYSQMLSHDPHEEKRYFNGLNAPVYPFGFGLSYTSFAYTNLHVAKENYIAGETVEVTVDLENTGQRTADEIAQLYIHQRYGTSSRPVRELKGFQRVRLKPKETRTLNFHLYPTDLQYWTEVTHGWVQDDTTYDVWIGGDSAAALAGTFRIQDH